MMCEKEDSALSSEGWDAVLVVAGLLVNLPGYGTSSILILSKMSGGSDLAGKGTGSLM